MQLLVQELLPRAYRPDEPGSFTEYRDRRGEKPVAGGAWLQGRADSLPGTTSIAPGDNRPSTEDYEKNSLRIAAPSAENEKRSHFNIYL